MHSIRMKHALRGPWWCGKEQHDTVPPPGLLHGDQYDPLTGAIERGDHGPIVGMVDFTGKTRYGFSSRGIPQYLFYPADPRFPPMIVGSKAPATANQWGIITTKGLVWTTTKSRWPSVGLQQLLGPVGTPEVEAEVLRLRYLRPVPRTKSAGVSASCVGSVESGKGLESVPTDERWDEVFNIDPAGCRDVDDLIAWRKVADGYEFAIGIANVAALVPHGSALDIAARQRAQTLYREGVAIEPMLPRQISEDAGSLLADGKSRGIVAAVWFVDLEGECATSEPVWRAFRIINQRTFTYESVLEDATISNMLPRFLEAITKAEVSPDPHRWIEVAMITYNCAAAEQIKGHGILRRHAGITQTSYGALAAKTGCTELAFLGYAAGEYVGSEAGKAGEDVSHAGLGVSQYCHATSPLRRYADLVNQRILVAMLEAEAVQGAEPGCAEWLNERAKEARAYEREAWCLAHLSAKELRSSRGWILEWKPVRTDEGTGEAKEVRLRVYVPEWRRQIKVTMALLRESEKGGICVGNRGNTGESWELESGSLVQVTAFWDTRSTPEHRFIFRISPCPPCPPCLVQTDG